MAHETHLVLRGRIFYLRLARPAHLQRLRRTQGLPVGREIWRSLGTADLWLARKRAAEAKAEWLAQMEREWNEISSGNLQPALSPSRVRRGRLQVCFPEVVSKPRQAQARERVTVSESPRSALAESEAVSAKRMTPPRGQRLVDYFERYLEEQRGGAIRRSAIDRRSTIRRFVESAGNLPVTAYTAEHVSVFKRALRDYPRNAEHLYPGLPFAKAIAQGRKDQVEPIAPKTINNKLSQLSAFGAWLELNTTGVKAESFRTTLVKDSRPDQRMRPFSDAEIKAILHAKAFTGCESEKNQSMAGTYCIRDWRYWVPLISAYTGARLGEIAQLRCVDLRQADDIWVFDITDEGHGQNLKTRTSRRLVPIHGELLQRGLLDFRQRVVDSGHEWLFETVVPDKDGRRATAIGKWFRKFLARLDVAQDARGAMHRFRHTVVTKLRAAGFPDHEIAPLIGHGVEIARMTAGYGAGQSVTVEKRAEMLSKLSYARELGLPPNVAL